MEKQNTKRTKEKINDPEMQNYRLILKISVKDELKSLFF